VFRTLRVRNCQFRFELFEIETHAFDDLRRHYHLWPSVMISQSDGYLGLEKLSEASLVLIDPPSLEAKPIVRCIQSLLKSKIPFICWTPRNSSSNGNKRESSKSISFGETAGIGTHLNISWEDPSGLAQQTFGCRVTVSDDLVQITDSVLAELATVMGWKRI